MNKYIITHIQLFDFAYNRQIDEEGNSEVVYSYSANLVINNEFIVQVSGDTDQATFDGIPDSGTCYWGSELPQSQAHNTITDSELCDYLEKMTGFENNIYWLEAHADEVMIPENVQYRPTITGSQS